MTLPMTTSMLRASWLEPKAAKDPARHLPPKRLVEKDTLSTNCGYVNWPLNNGTNHCRINSTDSTLEVERVSFFLTPLKIREFRWLSLFTR